MNRGNNRRGRGGGNRGGFRGQNTNRNNFQQSNHHPNNRQWNQNNNRNFDDHGREPKRQRRDGWFNGGGPGGHYRVKSEPRPYRNDSRSVKQEPEPEIQEVISPLPDIDFIGRNKHDGIKYEGCAYIGNVPTGVTKEALARYIMRRYVARDKDNCPTIVACSIREKEQDAFVEFQNAHDAENASEALHEEEFADLNQPLPKKNVWGKKVKTETMLRVTGKDEETYFTKFYYWAKMQAEAEKVKQEQAKAEPIVLDTEDVGVEVVEEPVSRELEYFRKKINSSNCIHISGLREGFGPKELARFIMKLSKKRLGNLIPKITACHVRSRVKDACVEFESHLSQIYTILVGPIKGINEGCFGKKWNQSLSAEFIKYYQEKEERKKQKKKAMDQQGKKSSERGLNASKDVGTPGAIIKHSRASAIALRKELIRLKEERKVWKKKRDVISAKVQQMREESDRYKKLFEKAKRQNQIREYNDNKLKEENEKLEKELEQEEEEVDTLRFNLNEMKTDSAELQEQIEKLQAENLEVRLKTLEGKTREVQKASFNLQAQITEMKAEYDEKNRNLVQAQQDLEKAREQRMQTENTLRTITEVQSGNEKDQRLVRVKEEFTYGAHELANLEWERDRLKRRLFWIIKKEEPKP